MGIRIPLVIRNVQIVGVLTSLARGGAKMCAPTVHWPPWGSPQPGGNKANVAHKKEKINSDQPWGAGQQHQQSRNGKVSSGDHRPFEVLGEILINYPVRLSWTNLGLITIWSQNGIYLVLSLMHDGPVLIPQENHIPKLWPPTVFLVSR